MSRIGRVLAALAAEHRKALATFITAGDPNLEATVPALHALVAGGADVIELGVPFSDPEAEGPAIQASSERGLAAGATLAGTLAMVRAFRQHDDATPVVLMGYLNPVLRMGWEPFAAAAADAGVDGLILVNLPPEEAGPLAASLADHGVDLILLVAPTTTAERAAEIAAHCRGFVYYVALKGITGADHLAVAPVAVGVRWLKGITPLPVLAGFGIKDAAAAAAVARDADGVAIGSALVNTMAALAGDPGAIPGRLEAQVAELRRALDGLPR